MDEGRAVERRRDAVVRIAPDGLPVVEFAEPRLVSGTEALAAIRAYREER